METSASPPRGSFERVPQRNEREKDGNSAYKKISDIRHGIGEGVDRLLDESHRFKSAVRLAFERFQLPYPVEKLPIDQLLPALQHFVQSISDNLDTKAVKLVLRPITQDDIRGAVECNPSLSLDSLITYQYFERIAREVLKRVALDRGKRLGLFMIGGIFAVHMTKGAIKKIPILGGPIGAIASVLVPTTVLGPAVGVAGALYL
ncbi:uncharacterized protein [Physcomitrium patens]|uniref:Uncharacterized protein n=1 Tax=Physcomitrium patens TaxID=3218 RepID=A0A2K1IG98_PHYPA|nr:uncharacterized protein LOC112276382 [Physcomitrium patens]XP_024363424.1 uncharacterized protein LOC112276382 [Physcomitrium patens]XP_024363425.1 uncharacterized protein LOC112276382 [Physcomitrium patens]PNR28301.1 hypothetical protein PHYPA_028893 [Physcomitrium patens]|eukprot:XP_024363423.1 uncharacterized protein LOC112276382 [Physcomitrella patens]